MAIYSIDHSDIVSAIEARATEGVRVRLILNKPSKEEELADRLEAAGVDVRFTNVTMHHKFAIADSTTLITGSCNWTRSAFARYDEDLLTFKKSGLIPVCPCNVENGARAVKFTTLAA